LATDRRTLLAAAAGLALAGSGRATGAADLVAVIAAARPSVVPVGTYSETANPRFGFRGSGFVVGDGQLVATNFHVLPPDIGGDSSPQLAVLAERTPTGGQLRRARVVASDRGQLEREGQAIALIGFPIGGTLGFAPVTHRGIVASITTVALPAPTAGQLDARAVTRLRAGNFEVFQLDATAYPGNSGGPVLDAASGRVVAIVNMVLVRGSRETALANPTGITYAVPVRRLHDLLREVGR
jgi:serine protease Do